MPFVTNQGIRIAFDERGSGPAVVLGHSFLCSRSMWEHQIGPLGDRYHLVNVDARGHGASQRPPHRFTLDDMVGDTVAVLDNLGIERAVWVGLSMGGMVAMRAALNHGDRVAGLILVDTDGGAETPWNRFKNRTLSSVARVVGLRPLLPEVARQMFGATTRRVQPELVDAWRTRFADMSVPAVLPVLRAIVGRNDVVRRLGSIDVPTLVMVGTEDVALPPERSRRLATAIPKARLVEIEAAGHLSALEQPAAVNAAMLEFLHEVYGGADARDRVG